MTLIIALDFEAAGAVWNGSTRRSVSVTPTLFTPLPQQSTHFYLGDDLLMPVHQTNSGSLLGKLFHRSLDLCCSIHPFVFRSIFYIPLIYLWNKDCHYRIFLRSSNKFIRTLGLILLYSDYYSCGHQRTYTWCSRILFSTLREHR
jgi:hypothetical protein